MSNKKTKHHDTLLGGLEVYAVIEERDGEEHILVYNIVDPKTGNIVPFCKGVYWYVDYNNDYFWIAKTIPRPYLYEWIEEEFGGYVVDMIHKYDDIDYTHVYLISKHNYKRKRFSLISDVQVFCNGELAILVPFEHIDEAIHNYYVVNRRGVILYEGYAYDIEVEHTEGVPEENRIFIYEGEVDEICLVYNSKTKEYKSLDVI